MGQGLKRHELFELIFNKMINENEIITFNYININNKAEWLIFSIKKMLINIFLKPEYNNTIMHHWYNNNTNDQE